MKILTKEQEQAHYNATLTGGILGGLGGLGVGALGVLAASRRYQFFRQLTLPLKAFLVTSSGTFAGIVSADHYSRSFERGQNPIDVEYDKRQREQSREASAGKSFTEKAMDFGKKERYKLVGGSWVAAMFIAFSIVNRNKFLTGQQKLVQARVYAQFLTLGVLVATAGFEISDQRNNEGRYESYQIHDPNDPEHKKMIERQRPVDSDAGDSLWKDMIAAEEARLKEREEDEKRIRNESQKKPSKKSHKKDTAEKDTKPADKKDTEADKKDAGTETKSDDKDAKKKGGENVNDKDQRQENEDKETTSDKQKNIPSANDAKSKK